MHKISQTLLESKDNSVIRSVSRWESCNNSDGMTLHCAVLSHASQGVKHPHSCWWWPPTPEVDIQDMCPFLSPSLMIFVGSYRSGIGTHVPHPPLSYSKLIGQPKYYSCNEVLLQWGFHVHVDLSHGTLNLLTTLDVAFKIACVWNSIWCWAYQKGVEEIALVPVGIACFRWWRIDRLWNEGFTENVPTFLKWRESHVLHIWEPTAEERQMDTRWLDCALG